MSDESTEDLLRKLVQLTRVSTYPVAKKILRDTFFDDGEPRIKRVLVYASLDGRTQSDVGEAAGVAQSTVSNWSGEWERLGLVGEDGEAVFDIYDFFPELEDEFKEDDDG